MESSVAQQTPTNLDSGIWRHQRRSGEIFFVNIFSHPVAYQGRSGRLVTAYDVQESIAARTALRSANTLLHEQRNSPLLLESSQSTYWLRVSPSRVILYKNTAFTCHFLSDQPAEPASFLSLVFQEDRPTMAQLFERLEQSKGEAEHALIRIFDAAGKQQYWTEWEWAPVLSANGELNYFQGIGREVTERIKHLHSLRTYEMELNRMLSAVNEVLWAVRVSDFSLVFLSESAEKVLGVKFSEAVGNPKILLGLFPKETQVYILQRLRSLANAPEGAEWVEEIELGSGRARRVLACRTFLLVNEASGERRIEGIITDLTNLRTTEDRLKEHQDAFHETLATLKDGFLVTNDRNQALFTNASFFSLMGLEKEKVIGNYLGQVFDAPHFSRLRSYFTQNPEAASTPLEWQNPLTMQWFRVACSRGSKITTFFFSAIFTTK